MARWYPNGDGGKCSGSFKIALYYPDANGKVECGACGRKVGLRNPITRQNRAAQGSQASSSLVGRGRKSDGAGGEMKHILFSELSTLVPVSKRVSVTPPSTGFTTVHDGHVRVTTEVVVDTAALHEMARRASRSKGGKCVDGPVTVRVLGRAKA